MLGNVGKFVKLGGPPVLYIYLRSREFSIVYTEGWVLKILNSGETWKSIWFRFIFKTVFFK